MNRSLQASLLIFLCAIAVRIAPAQSAVKQVEDGGTQPKPNGVITGRVVGSDGQPVAGASILVIKAGGPVTSNLQTVTSGDEGGFRVTGLNPGSYIFYAYTPGYVTARAGGELDFHLPGENVTINLVQGGAITGRVTDAYGEPMVGVRVHADKVRDLDVGERYAGDLVRSSGRLTDDRGVYRLYGLEPGAYVVGVSNDTFGAYNVVGHEVTTWHPSSPRATATEITVRSGGEVAGVDIRHRGERGYTISGTAGGDGPSGQHPENVRVILLNVIDKRVAGTTGTVGSKGFAMYGVPDGEYEIIAVRVNETLIDFANSAPRRVVVKGADISGLELKISAPASIAGQVKIEPLGAADAGRSACAGESQTMTRANREEVLLRAAPDGQSTLSIESLIPQLGMFPGAIGAGAPDEKGEFILNLSPPGRYRIKTDLPNLGWYVRAITQPAAGAAKTSVDLARDGVALKSGEKLSGVELVLAEGAAGFKGRVVAPKERAKLPSHLRVHLIPVEPSSADDVLRYAEALVRGDGAFEFNHLAPGKYLLLARPSTEGDANEDSPRPVAWDAGERAKLRREAAAAKNEVELQPCARVKDYVLRFIR
jgi:hypothetical protein